MRDEIAADFHAPESGPLSRRVGGLRAVDRAVVLAQVTSILSAGRSLLSPAEALTAACEAAERHLQLRNVVFFERLAGRSRTLTWSAPGTLTQSRMIAREQGWSAAARFVEGQRVHEGSDDDRVASTSVWDERLALSAMLYVESQRPLDQNDRGLLTAILRRLLVLPETSDDAA